MRNIKALSNLSPIIILSLAICILFVMLYNVGDDNDGGISFKKENYMLMSKMTLHDIHRSSPNFESFSTSPRKGSVLPVVKDNIYSDMYGCVATTRKIQKPNLSPNKTLTTTLGNSQCFNNRTTSLVNGEVSPNEQLYVENIAQGFNGEFVEGPTRWNPGWGEDNDDPGEGPIGEPLCMLIFACVFVAMKCIYKV